MADVKEEVKSDEQQNYSVGNNSSDPNNLLELTQYIQTLLTQTQEKFQAMSDQIITRNEMGNRIDDLEKNISDLMSQAGVEGQDK